MNKKIMMTMFLVFVAVAPAGAVDADKATSKAEVVAASGFTGESVDCFFDQNRYLQECKK